MDDKWLGAPQSISLKRKITNTQGHLASDMQHLWKRGQNEIKSPRGEKRALGEGGADLPKLGLSITFPKNTPVAWNLTPLCLRLRLPAGQVTSEEM